MATAEPPLTRIYSADKCEYERLLAINAELQQQNQQLKMRASQLEKRLHGRDEEIAALYLQIEELRRGGVRPSPPHKTDQPEPLTTDGKPHKQGTSSDELATDHSDSEALDTTTTPCAQCGAGAMTARKIQQYTSLNKKLHYQKKLLKLLSGYTTSTEYVQIAGLDTGGASFVTADDRPPPRPTDSFSIYLPSLAASKANNNTGEPDRNPPTARRRQSTVRSSDELPPPRRHLADAAPPHQPSNGLTKRRLNADECAPSPANRLKLNRTTADGARPEPPGCLREAAAGGDGLGDRQCPCCFANYGGATQREFEEHVLDCVETQLYREARPRETDLSREELRACPICGVVVPYELGQSEYEAHVMQHLDVADMQYEEVHYKEAERIPAPT